MFLDYFPSPTRILHEIQMQVLEKQRLKQNSKDIETGKILLIDQVKQTKGSVFGTSKRFFINLSWRSTVQ